MQILPEQLEDYIAKHSQEEPQLLKELRRETHLKILQPRMLSGHYQGRFLSIISKLISPKNILEIGTYTGYSALCLAEGLKINGELHTIDINEELYDFQRKYFDRSEFVNKIHQHVGNALEIIPSLNKTFDLVFIDADKEDYINYFNIIIDKVNSGGVILSDNVLWSGKVLDGENQIDEATKSLVAYNKMMNDDERIESILLPIRDGLTISRKK
ncbi:MAG: O-methyltransferase [Flavobacteriaceae bacterium]|nr:O-methyltransferase [Flavobacteriaceae bacterium]